MNVVPLSCGAIYVDSSAVLGHDPVYNVESQPCAASSRFCREERIEYLAQVLMRYAVSRIFYRNFGESVIGQASDREDSLVMHGVYGIDDEIYEYLLQFSGVGEDIGVLLKFGLNVDREKRG